MVVARLAAKPCGVQPPNEVDDLLSTLGCPRIAAHIVDTFQGSATHIYLEWTEAASVNALHIPPHPPSESAGDGDGPSVLECVKGLVDYDLLVEGGRCNDIATVAAAPFGVRPCAAGAARTRIPIQERGVAF